MKPHRPKRRPLLELLEPRQLLSTTLYVDASSPGPTHNGSSWSSAYTDLQLALSAATSGTTIEVAQGIYKPTTTTTRTISFQLKTGVAIYGGYAGSSSPTPDSRDVAAYLTILSGDIGIVGTSSDNSYHVITMPSGTNNTAALEGFTITAGNANGLSTAADGGGIYIASGSPTLRNCTFTANSASSGSAIYNSFSSPLVTNCVFSANSFGGVIYNTSSSIPAITDCIFTSNSGPCISNFSSSPTISRCSFTSNAGPGIINATASSPVILDCSFTRNSINANGTLGGAIANSGSSAPLIANCCFAANSATDGGGIYNSNSSPIITNCTFSGNNSDYGGALYNKSSSPIITNCIFWDDAAYGNGIDIYNSGTSTPVVSFCDIGGAFPGSGNVAVDPLFIRNPSSGLDDTWGTADDDPGNLVISPASPVADAGNNAAVPLIASVDLAGALRFQDIPTTADSGAGVAPLVDMGAFEATPSLLANAGGPYVVLQGQSLTLTGHGASTASGALRYAWDFNGDGVYDDASGTSPAFPVSAYPVGGSLTISLRVTDDTDHAISTFTTLRIAPLVAHVDPRAITGTGDGVSWTDAFPDLQSALARSIPGQTIRVASGTYMPTNGSDRTTSFHLKSGVTLYGGYAGFGTLNPDARDLATYTTTLSGNIGTASSIADNSYHVLTATGTDTTALLDGFTITDGNANGGSGTSYLLGGGLYNYLASPSIANCTFVSNSAVDGAAIANTSSSPSILNCIFMANSANYGGAVHNNITSSPTLTGCTFSSNAASSEGGAIFDNASCAPLIINSAFNNDSAFIGGAIYNNSASPTITGSTFTSNSASEGGAISNNASSAPTISNSTFSSNFTTAGSGGAISNQSASPVITACTFSDNSSGTQFGGAIYNNSGSALAIFTSSFTGNFAGNGGAIYNASSSTFVVNDCTFTRNTAMYGGAVNTIYGISLNRSWFTANSASAAGGALYISSSSASINTCTFLANSAAGVTANSGGGAIYATNGSIAISSCLFIGNSAPAGDGGALRNYFASPTLVNCTLVSNTAARGGAISVEYLSPVTSLVNCITWSNTATTGAAFYALVNSAFAITYSDIQAGYTGTGNISSDPLFYRNPSPGPDNTWSTPDDDYGDLRLLPGSPAIDTGSNAAVPSGITTDFANNPRITDFPAAGPANTPVVDMGAYESSTNLGSLHLTSGQTVTLPAGNYSFTATSLTLDPGSSLDLADDSLLLDYTGPSPLTIVRQYLHDHLLTSSASTPNHSIAYAESSDLGLTSFNNQPVDPTSLLLKYTLTGDANLDGKITPDDFALADRGLAKSSSTWTAGDFNYDGSVTPADLTLLDESFAASTTPPAPTLVPLVSPTPSTPAPQITPSTDPITPKILSKKAGVLTLSIKISKSLKSALSHNAPLRIYFSRNSILDKNDSLVLTELLPKNLKTNSSFNLHIKIPSSLLGKPWHILATAKPKPTPSKSLKSARH